MFFKKIASTLFVEEARVFRQDKKLYLHHIRNSAFHDSAGANVIKKFKSS